MIPPLLMNDSIAAIAFFYSLKSLVIFTLNNLFTYTYIKSYPEPG